MSGNVAASPPEPGFCRQCGVALTAQTRRTWQGIPHCCNCLEKPAGSVAAGHASAPRPAAAAALPPGAASRPSAPPAAPDAAPSALLAFILGCIPGLGAVYNGQYVKGLIHILMFGSLLTVIVEGQVKELYGLFVPLLAFLVLYQPFEAMRTARALRRGEEVNEFSGIIDLMFGGAPSIAGSVSWIAFGVVFFLHALGIWELTDVLPFWPLLLMALGVWRLFRAVIPKQRAEEEAENGPAAEFSRGEPVG